MVAANLELGLSRGEASGGLRRSPCIRLLQWHLHICQQGKNCSPMPESEEFHYDWAGSAARDNTITSFKLLIKSSAQPPMPHSACCDHASTQDLPRSAAMAAQREQWPSTALAAKFTRSTTSSVFCGGCASSQLIYEFLDSRCPRCFCKLAFGAQQALFRTL